MTSRRIRNVLVLAAIGIAAIIAIATLSAPPETREGREAVELSAAQQPPALTTGMPKTGKPNLDTLGINEGTVIQVADPKTGLLMREIMWEQLTPQEQGVFEMTFPQARFYLAPWRVIHMRSDEGRFVAPGNHPQSGEFRKNVVINVFQTERGGEVDLSADSADRVLEIKLDQATFDTTLGEVKSDSRVELSTPVTEQVRFTGKGLRLLYNELSRRIDYLEIVEGEVIRYRPPPEAPPEVSPQVPAEIASEKGADAKARPDERGATTDAAPKDEEAKPQAVQYYRVEFDRAIKVIRGERTIEADKLVVFFSMDQPPESEADKPLTPAKDESAAAAAARREQALAALALQQVMRIVPLVIGQVGAEPAISAGVVPGAPGVPGAGDPGPDGSLSLAVKGRASAAEANEEVVVTWSGRMVMVPVEYPPQDFTAAEDLYARFEGSPVTVTLAPAPGTPGAPGDAVQVQNVTAEAEQLVCRTLEYLDAAATGVVVTATGNDAYPMRIISPQMHATADRLVMQPERGLASLMGPGSLRGPEHAAAAPALDVADTGKDKGNSSSRQLPPGFRVTWSEGVDLAYTPGPAPAPGNEATGEPADAKLAAEGIDSAVFRGDVRVEDPQMRLASRQLAVAFAPVEGSADRQLKTIGAAGAVEIEMGESRVKADKLHVETAPGRDGRLVPSRMVAEGNVDVVDPTQQIAANMLVVTLREKPPEPPKAPEAEKPATAAAAPAEATPVVVDVAAPAAAEAAKPASLQQPFDLEPTTITAIGAVKLKLEDGTTVVAERLDADALTGNAVLTGGGAAGQTGRPVVILNGERTAENPQPISELYVMTLNLSQFGKVAHAAGAGTFIYTKPDNVQAGYKGQRVRVTWTKSMRFDDAANLLQVEGDVVAESEDKPTELNRIKAGQMILELIDVEALAAANAGIGPAVEPPKDATAVQAGPGAGGAPTAHGLRMNAAMGRRELKMLTATGDVELLATVWADATKTHIKTQFLLLGPGLTFRQADQVAQVRGPGKMLLRDERPAPPDEVAAAGSPPMGARRMSGRGSTVFTWTELLTMDRTRNDLTILGNVEMTHQPLASPGQTAELVQLDCDRLFADMETRGKLDAVAMSQVESMEILAIDAAGGVRIQSGGDTVVADRILYDGKTQDVMLRAEGDGRVTVTRATQPKPLRGRIIHWNLKTGEFEITDAGL